MIYRNMPLADLLSNYIRCPVLIDLNLLRAERMMRRHGSQTRFKHGLDLRETVESVDRGRVIGYRVIREDLGEEREVLPVNSERVMR
jgi:hypothetical protein